MQEEYAIEVKNITKSFKVYLDKGNTMKEKMLFKKRRRYEERKVLQGISFQVKKGEAIGLVGHNGCGKSTTLKLLTRIMYPDSGEIVMRGRVSSLIELGAGFHPDMSGRENIYINASIFGLTRKEIDERLQEIIDFSELEQFIDNPVRTYSSGMYMRLAFSVAINVNADILLIDEILAVGDANFQNKCFGKLKEIKKSGTTIVIVSHSLGQIEQICERSIWINEGKIQAEGSPYEVHPEYLRYMDDRRNEAQNGQAEDDNNTTVRSHGHAYIEKAVIKNQNGNVTGRFQTGETIKLLFDIKAKKTVREIHVGVSIVREDGVYCYGTNTKNDDIAYVVVEGATTLQLILSDINLLPGRYYFDFEVKDLDGYVLDYYQKAFEIEIVSATADVGICKIDHEWSGATICQ